MTEGAGDENGRPGDGNGDRAVERERGPATCDESGCGRPAAVRLHIPWDDDRTVCTAHARVLARPDGVVAEPIEGAEWE